MIQLYVPAIPVAQPRQRHRVVRLPGGRAFAQNYTPKRDPVNSFKATVRAMAHQAHQGPALRGPIRLDVEFVFPRPKHLIWKRRPMPRLPHTSRPDRDNLDKAVLDALKGLLFADDAQVYQGSIAKYIASGDEQPHVRIVIEERVDA